MTWLRAIAFAAGVAVLAALTVFAGADSVIQSLRALRLSGLLLIAALHLPAVFAMGIAWWLIGRDFPGTTRLNFAWARLVRDAAADALPLSQIGGFVLGVRALHLSGVSALRGALSMSVDLVMELWAKGPYFLAGLFALLLLSPHAPVSVALPAALGLTALLAAASYALRGRLRTGLEAAALAICSRWPALGTGEDAPLFFTRLFAQPDRLVASFAIHLVCWLFGAVEMWVVLALMGLHVRPLEAFAIDSLVSGLRTFAFLVPAAAGVQEACYVLVGSFFAIAPAAAVAVSLARRARDLALALPVLAAWQFREANSMRATTGS